MMQSLEAAACEEGEVSSYMCCQCEKTNAISLKANMVCTHNRSFRKIKTNRNSSLPLQPNQDEAVPTEIITPKPQFCIHTKLRELHLEECANDPNPLKIGLKRNSHLLEKLVAKERLNTLILNLYPGNKGYSLTLPNSVVDGDSVDCMTSPDETGGGTAGASDVLETKQWPYEEEELLRYIDNEELPAYLVDLFDHPHCNFLFYSGCIIVKVRDYRQAYPHFKCDIHHVLLKPSFQTVLADVNTIVDEKVDWGAEEKYQLESQILLANHPTLCLDPNSSISATTTRINHNKLFLNTNTLRRAARKSSQVTVNRKRKLDQFTHRPHLELFDFVSARSKSKGGASKIAKKVLHEEIKPIPVPNLDTPGLNPPTQGVHINEFKAYARQTDTSDCLPQLVEEYVLETDMHSKDNNDKKRVYHIKLSILQRPSNDEYLCELYLDRDYKKGERNGVACRFSLGTRVHVNRYIQQFTDIFTEGGRKSVRIFYGSNPGVKERVAQAHAQQAQMQNMQNTAPQVNLAQQHLAQLTQSLQNQSCGVTPIVNGNVNAGITLVQQNQTIPNTSVPVLQAQLQATPQVKTTSQATNEELEISALATSLMNSVQQFQAAANAKQQQQQQQQKLASSSNHAAIINLLNSQPASSINSDASAAVVNAINNTTLLPQQVQTINQKLLGRKITLANVPNSRVLNHNNHLIAVNNNRMCLTDLTQQGQTITLTTVNSGNFVNYTTIKQPVNQRILTTATPANANESKSTLSALLVGTPAADRPDIIGSNTNPLLLEKLAGTSPNAAQSPTHFIQSPKQYVVQSPKNNVVMSPMSSPPPTTPQNTINLQSLNFAPLQNLSGLQNVQVQLGGYSQPISLSLNVSSTGTLQGHPTSLLVSLPVTTGRTTAATSTIAGSLQTTTVVTPMNVASPTTMVLANAGTSNIAQLVTSNVKGLSQQGLRAVGPGVTLTQGGPPFQLITPLQRPRMQQTQGVPQNIAIRGLQRTPITIKMATPQTNLTHTSTTTTLNNLQKQQFEYQQMLLDQQPQNISGKLRRRSNVSEPQ